jgi:AraC-like DNA-binding protein
LDDPAHDHLSIAAIAFLSGFNDLSTFNRRFRTHYGMSPRDARRVRAPAGEGLSGRDSDAACGTHSSFVR